MINPLNESLIFSLPHYSLIAIRIQANIPARTHIPAHLVGHSYATLTCLSPEYSTAHSIYQAEPCLAAAASSLMSQGLNARIALMQLLAATTLYGAEQGAGGEVLAMLTAVASIDYLTSNCPYLAVTCRRFLETWLGLSSPDLLSGMQRSVLDGRISISQFVYASITVPKGKLLELGRLYGVGFIPRSRTNKGYDLMLPFETLEGDCGAILAEIKFRASFGGKELKKAKANIESICDELRESWPIKSAEVEQSTIERQFLQRRRTTRLQWRFRSSRRRRITLKRLHLRGSTVNTGRMVVPLILSLGTGEVHFKSGKKWKTAPLSIKETNSWNQQDLLLRIKEALFSFESTYEQTEWTRNAKKFHLNADVINSFTSQWFAQM